MTPYHEEFLIIIFITVTSKNHDGNVDANDDDTNNNHDDDEDEDEDEIIENKTATFLLHTRDHTISNTSPLPAATVRKKRTNSHLHHLHRNRQPSVSYSCGSFRKPSSCSCTLGTDCTQSVYKLIPGLAPQSSMELAPPCTFSCHAQLHAGVRLGYFAHTIYAVIMCISSSIVLLYIN